MSNTAFSCILSFVVNEAHQCKPIVSNFFSWVFFWEFSVCGQVIVSIFLLLYNGPYKRQNAVPLLNAHKYKLSDDSSDEDVFTDI